MTITNDGDIACATIDGIPCHWCAYPIHSCTRHHTDYHRLAHSLLECMALTRAPSIASSLRFVHHHRYGHALVSSSPSWSIVANDMIWSASSCHNSRRWLTSSSSYKQRFWLNHGRTTNNAWQWRNHGSHGHGSGNGEKKNFHSSSWLPLSMIIGGMSTIYWMTTTVMASSPSPSPPTLASSSRSAGDPHYHAYHHDHDPHGHANHAAHHAQQHHHHGARHGRLTIFSGGNGFNTTAILLKSFTTHTTYIMPVSDNGGSTAEISRILGGPALGDIRSRLMALASDHTVQERAVIQLLKYRLPNHPSDDSEARLEWNRIVEGTHPLWHNMSPACKATIRSFLVHFQHEVLNSEERFDFRNGSVGNFFFTGTRLFFRSVDAAIFWFSGLTSIPRVSSVVPVLHTNSRVTIGAECMDGSIIIGQSEISHPVVTAPVPTHPVASSSSSSPSPTVAASSVPIPANNTTVDKHNTSALASPIKKLMYVNDDGQETWPEMNTIALHRLRRSNHVIYGQGSLYTSVIPCLILPGVGEAVSNVRGRKILILNGSHDRETTNMTAIDFVTAITHALNRYGELKLPATRYIDTLIVNRDSSIECDVDQLRRMGIAVHYVANQDEQPELYDEHKLVHALLDLTTPPSSPIPLAPTTAASSSSSSS